MRSICSPLVKRYSHRHPKHHFPPLSGFSNCHNTLHYTSKSISISSSASVRHHPPLPADCPRALLNSSLQPRPAYRTFLICFPAQLTPDNDDADELPHACNQLKSSVLFSRYTSNPRLNPHLSVSLPSLISLPDGVALVLDLAYRSLS